MVVAIIVITIITVLLTITRAGGTTCSLINDVMNKRRRGEWWDHPSSTIQEMDVVHCIMDMGGIACGVYGVQLCGQRVKLVNILQ